VNAVEQHLAVERLSFRLAAVGERDDGGRGQSVRGQNLNSNAPNTVRPGAIVA
jgi:hypothetical protein